MIFYVFFETDSDYGRFRRSVGFRTAEARQAWVKRELADLELHEDTWLSDLEEWDSDDPSWSHLPVIG